MSTIILSVLNIIHFFLVTVFTRSAFDLLISIIGLVLWTGGFWAYNIYPIVLLPQKWKDTSQSNEKNSSMLFFLAHSKMFNFLHCRAFPLLVEYRDFLLDTPRFINVSPLCFWPPKMVMRDPNVIKSVTRSKSKKIVAYYLGHLKITFII